MNHQTPTDCSWFKTTLKNKGLVDKLAAIKLIICDVDGTLTDAHVYTDQNGEGGRMFSTQDGFIVPFILKTGIKIAFISGKKNQSTIHRAKMIGIPEEFCICGVDEKITAIKKLQKKLSLSKKQTLAFGDDILDANIKEQDAAAILVCPQNAPFYIKTMADLVIPHPGGNNAFRLFIDLLLFNKKTHPYQRIITRTLKKQSCT